MNQVAVDPIYVMGISDHERQRLIEQAAIYDRSTRHLLADAGIGAGMRVLDVGCGVGDVTLLAAEVVGPSGQVVGVDSDSRSLAVAADRARRAGLAHASFHESDLRELEFEEPFDAVVGRFVLMYLANPTATVTGLTRHLRPGGIVAFQEFQFDELMRTWPHVPGSLYEKTLDWVLATFRAAGVATSMGVALPWTLRDAGLRLVDAYVHCPLAGGPDHAAYQLFEHVLGSLLPLMEAFGVARADEVGVDGYAVRLSEEAVRLDAVGCCAPVVSAWANADGAGSARRTHTTGWSA